MNADPSLYVLIGCPGSGKGTFTQAILSDGYIPVSTGDITREEVKNETPFGIKYKDAILKHISGVVPSEEIQKLVERRLEDALHNQKGAILDGYPKTIEQCLLLDRFIEKNDLENRVAFLLLNVKEEEAIERIIYRQLCAQCGKIYHSKWAPPKVKNTCDACLGKLYRRLDAYMEWAKKRVYTFQDKLHPVIGYYQSRLTVMDTNAPLEECMERFLRYHRSTKTSSAKE